jgi:hypothetical protein
MVKPTTSTRNERNVSTRYAGTTIGAPMLTGMSGVTAKITAAAGVVPFGAALAGCYTCV